MESILSHSPLLERLNLAILLPPAVLTAPSSSHMPYAFNHAPMHLVLQCPGLVKLKKQKPKNLKDAETRDNSGTLQLGKICQSLPQEIVGPSELLNLNPHTSREREDSL